MVETRGTAVEVRLPSRLGFEKVAMGTAASVAQLMGFPQDRIEDLKTALAEACINAIEHGNMLNDNLCVGVILSASDEELEVKVMDNGNGIAKSPARPDIDRKMLGEEDPRGMGMFLIQSLVDEAEWVKGSPGKGSYVRLVIRLPRRLSSVQTETKAKVDEVLAADGRQVAVLRFTGDISSSSRDTVLGTYEGVGKSRPVLIDFSKVEYINSSGIALVIQMLMEANKAAQTIAAFGLTPHFQKVFTMVGITKYAALHRDEATAIASL